MGLLDILTKVLSSSAEKSLSQGIINGYGKNKIDGSHDHRTNKGADRTPAQKEADAKKKKD